MFFIHRQPYAQQKGFTLIEIMVSLSIFAVVMVIALGTLLVLVRASAVAQATQTITNNLSFALDNMSRNIRTGYYYYCSDTADPDTQSGSQVNDCSGEDSIVFTDGGASNSASDRMGYRLNNGTVEQKIEGEDWIAVTSNQISVSTLEFYLNGSEDTGAGDTEQPNIRIIIRGTAGDTAGLTTAFDLQTTIASRGADF